VIGNVPWRHKHGGLSAQARVVYALLMREMQMRFGRSRIGYVWLVGEPLMLAIGISSIHWFSDRGLPNNIPVFMFYGMGYLPFFMFRGIMTRNAGAIQGNIQLLYHRSIKLHDLTIARSLLEAAACAPVIMLFILGGIFFADVWPAKPGLFVLSLVLSALLAHGFATIITSLIVFVESLERLIHPLTYLMMPFSGAFAMVDSLPQNYQNILLWNPLVHVHEAFRDAQWGDKIVSHYNIPYVLLWILIFNLLAMAALRAARPHVSLSH
jgi:capsular polysaccharide transport system permease protein